jgi:hypothetical protein
VPGTIGTCDSWNCQVDRILFLHEFYGSLAEDMEGDAVAQICQTYDVPFLDIRILSNTVFEGNKDWVLDAGTVCQAYVLDLVRQYISQAGADMKLGGNSHSVICSNRSLYRFVYISYDILFKTDFILYIGPISAIIDRKELRNH